jgi:hypothetical protein
MFHAIRPMRCPHKRMWRLCHRSLAASVHHTHTMPIA